MKHRYIPALVMLIAGLICCMLSVIQSWPIQRSLISLSIVLFVFNLIGQIAAKIVIRVHAEHIAMIEAERKRLEEEKKARLEAEKKAKEEEEERKKREEDAKLEEEWN